MRFFNTVGAIIMTCGVALGIRFLVYLFIGEGTGHIQSLILTSMLILVGFQTFLIGLQADLIAANRKLIEDVQYHVRKMDYDGIKIKEDVEKK